MSLLVALVHPAESVQLLIDLFQHPRVSLMVCVNSFMVLFTYFHRNITHTMGKPTEEIKETTCSMLHYLPSIFLRLT